LFDLATDNLDVLPGQSCKWPGDLARRATTGDQPEQGGREQMMRLPVDEYHPMLRCESLPQFTCCDDAAYAAPEDDDHLSGALES
jgi:hypothetical protein